MFLRLLVVLSLVLSATGLGILALQLLQPPGQPQQVARVEAPPAVAPAPKIRMLVAARPLSIGTLLKDDDMREMEVSGMEAIDDARAGASRLRILLPHRPDAGQGPSVQRQASGCRVLALHVRSEPAWGLEPREASKA